MELQAIWEEEVVRSCDYIIRTMERVKEREAEQRNRDAVRVSKIIKDMMPTILRSLWPVDKKKNWVFWKQDALKLTSTNKEFHNRIKNALYNYDPPYLQALLIQFWAPEMIGGRCHLTTTLQPFSLSNLRNEKLNHYRKHCVGLRFVVADEEENDENLIMEGGIIGRVFQNQLPEYCGDLSEYSVREYPQRDVALSCGIKSTVAFPVFEVEPFGSDYCVGVLELLYPMEFCLLFFELQHINRALKEVRLRTILAGEIQDQINGLYEVHIQKEIKAALEQVCETYNLNHAITWVSWSHISCKRISCNDSRKSFQGESLVASHAMSFFSKNHMQDCYFASPPLRAHQGLVGKAFSSLNPYFCRDVCQLTMSEYPLVQIARSLRLATCFAVCMRTISTGNREFVVEFFQRRNETYSGDPVSLFSSILATMRQRLKSFEVVTGDPENEIFTEVYKCGESFVKASTGKGKSVINKELSNTSFTSYKTISTPTMSDEELTEPEYSSHSLRMTESKSSSMYRIHAPPSCKRRKRVNELDQVTSESSFSVNQGAQKADHDCGFKDLGSKVFLEKSETGGSGNSETGSTNFLKLSGCMMTVSQPHVRRDSSHSDAPLSEASAVVAHNVPLSTPVSNVELMNIKVKFGKDFIMFELPLSAGMADLMENVLMRLRMLKNKAFVIKYLDDSSEEILLDTDKELQDCMVRTRLRGNNLLRMLIYLKEDEEELPEYMDEN